MLESYFDKLYLENNQYFGEQADSLLKDYYSFCDTKGRVLDIGIGQGRNAKFLLKHGFVIDGIEPSKVAVDNLQKQIEQDKLDLKLFNMGFEDFSCPPRTYSTILLFGVFPVLSEKQIICLAQKTRRWLKKGGIVFVTGFTTKESAFRPKDSEWEKVSEESYQDGKGNYRTFLDLETARKKFRRFKTIYCWEGVGEEHAHGNDVVEQHHCFELILQRN